MKKPSTKDQSQTEPSRSDSSSFLEEEKYTALQWAREAAAWGATPTPRHHRLAEGAPENITQNPQSQNPQDESPSNQASTHRSRPETQEQIIRIAMKSQEFITNLEARNHSRAIVAAYLRASELRTELDQWHSGAGPKPWGWQPHPGTLREQSDSQDPNLRVLHTHTTISGPDEMQRSSHPAWLCTNCNDRSICRLCPCLHWPRSENGTPSQLDETDNPEPLNGEHPHPKGNAVHQENPPMGPDIWDKVKELVIEHDSYSHTTQDQCLTTRDIRFIARQYQVQDTRVKGIFDWCIRTGRLPNHPNPNPAPTRQERTE